MEYIQHLCNSLVPNVDNGEEDIVETGSSVTPTLADWQKETQKYASYQFFELTRFMI